MQDLELGLAQAQGLHRSLAQHGAERVDGLLVLAHESRRRRLRLTLGGSGVLLVAAPREGDGREQQGVDGLAHLGLPGLSAPLASLVAAWALHTKHRMLSGAAQTRQTESEQGLTSGSRPPSGIEEECVSRQRAWPFVAGTFAGLVAGAFVGWAATGPRRRSLDARLVRALSRGREARPAGGRARPHGQPAPPTGRDPGLAQPRQRPRSPRPRASPQAAPHREPRRARARPPDRHRLRPAPRLRLHRVRGPGRAARGRGIRAGARRGRGCRYARLLLRLASRPRRERPSPGRAPRRHRRGPGRARGPVPPPRPQHGRPRRALLPALRGSGARRGRHLGRGPPGGERAPRGHAQRRRAARPRARSSSGTRVGMSYTTLAASVVARMPSVYQLLPPDGIRGAARRDRRPASRATSSTPRPGNATAGVPSAPPSTSAASRERAFVKAALARARAFHEALARTPDAPVPRARHPRRAATASPPWPARWSARGRPGQPPRFEPQTAARAGADVRGR